MHKSNAVHSKVSTIRKITVFCRTAKSFEKIFSHLCQPHIVKFCVLLILCVSICIFYIVLMWMFFWWMRVLVMFYFSWPDVLHFSSCVGPKWDKNNPWCRCFSAWQIVCNCFILLSLLNPFVTACNSVGCAWCSLVIWLTVFDRSNVCCAWEINWVIFRFVHGFSVMFRLSLLLSILQLVLAACMA